MIEYTIKESPNALWKMFRFQVGILKHREEMEPVWNANSIDYWRKSSFRKTPVFHLLGCGETLDKAKKMAGVK